MGSVLGAGAAVVATGSSACAAGAGAAAGAAGAAGFSSPKLGSSNIGPLVALIPAAGLLLGIAGRSNEAAGAGVSVALASVSFGASVAVS